MGRSLTFMGGIAVTGLIAAGGPAFAASNTVHSSGAGAGSTTVTGYTTTAIHYEQNATNPHNLDSVTVALNSAATYVAVRTHSGGPWYTNEDARLPGAEDSCTSGSNGTVWTCVVTGNSETIAAVGDLDVVAAA